MHISATNSSSRVVFPILPFLTANATFCLLSHNVHFRMVDSWLCVAGQYSEADRCAGLLHSGTLGHYLSVGSENNRIWLSRRVPELWLSTGLTYHELVRPPDTARMHRHRRNCIDIHCSLDKAQTTHSDIFYSQLHSLWTVNNFASAADLGGTWRKLNSAYKNPPRMGANSWNIHAVGTVLVYGEFQNVH